MQRAKSSMAACLVAITMVLGACGPGAAADLTTPTGGVTAAFEAAKAGGLLKQMDFFGCVFSGGAGLFTGFLGALSADAIAASGIDPDEFLGAFSSSFSDFKVTETSRSGDRAVVHLSVKISLDVDRGKVRDLIKRYAETQGLSITDAQIEAAMTRQFAGLPGSEVLEHDVDAVLRDGTWHACDGTPIAGVSPTVPAGPSGGSGGVPVAGWQPYVADGGGYVVSMPGTASTATRTMPSPQGNIEIHEAGWQSPDQQTLFYTLYADYPAGSLSSLSERQALDELMTMVVSQFQGTLGQTSDVTIGGHSGRRFEMTNSSGQLRGLVAVNGDRAYVLLAGGPGANDADIDEFLDSFTITGEPPPPPPSAPPPPTPEPSTGQALGPARAVSAGEQFTCAVTVGGAAKCWGFNLFGQLGDGTQATSHGPVDVVGLATGVSSIGAGSNFACALTTAGGVKCWGRNDEGQLGNAGAPGSNTPVDVTGLGSGVAAIAVGWFHACALTTSGGVKCWGADGAVGNGDVGPRDGPAPVDVIGLTSGVNAIAIGGTHSCALLNAGTVKCWGWGASGELGEAAMVARRTPVDVLGLPAGITAIGAGEGHSCALAGQGPLYCWGQNNQGQVGTGTPTAANVTAPTQVVGLKADNSAVAAGRFRSCLLTTAGAVKCWGFNGWKELGDDTLSRSATPVAVPGLASGVTAISVGGSHMCALAAGGAVRCWGDAATGALGDATTTFDPTP